MSSKEVNAMPLQAWRAYVTALVRGVRKNLCASAPRRIRDRLDAFEAQARTLTGMRARTQWADDFDAFVEGPPCVHAAANRYLAPQFKKIIRMANRLQRTAKRLQKKIAAKSKQDAKLDPQPGLSRAESKRRWAQAAATAEKTSKLLDFSQIIVKTAQKRFIREVPVWERFQIGFFKQEWL